MHFIECPEYKHSSSFGSYQSRVGKKTKIIRITIHDSKSKEGVEGGIDVFSRGEMLSNSQRSGIQALGVPCCSMSSHGYLVFNT